ncbi:MAG: extracellular solute-binding protein [Lachnospiraceae bacterium]|nr:extracellular solute-binding protein [Lachnospiraceae bacterium]
MRCRGTTRLLALVMVLAMLMSSVVVFADTDDTDSTDDTATVTDADTTDDSTSSSSDEYVDERLEKNYTHISATYTYAQYTGSDVVYDITEAWDSSSDGELVSDTYGSYSHQVLSASMGDVVSIVLDVDKAGVYALYMDVLTSDEESILDPEYSLKLNGDYPFYEAKQQTVNTAWLQDTDENGDIVVSYDKYGHEIVTSPVKSMVWLTQTVTDSSARYSTPLLLQLEAGENVIELTMTEGDLWIGDITLSADDGTSTDTYTGSASDVTETADLITIDAEYPVIRNDSSIRPTCEYDVNLSPYSTIKKVMNMLDGASFADAGQSITYEFTVETSGYYYLGFKYRQTDKKDFPVFVDLSIDEYNADGTVNTTDDTIQYDEMVSYAFDYSSSFTKTALTDDDGEYMSIYLEAGTHTLTMTIVADYLREALETVDRVMSEINDLSLEITKIAGSNTDKYRDIDVMSYIDDIDVTFTSWIDDLKAIYEDLCQYTDSSNPGALSSLKIAYTQLEDLAEDYDEIPYRQDELCTSSSSVSQYLANFITDVDGNDLSLDSIYIYQSDSQLPKNTNVFVSLWESIKRLVGSFTDQSYSVDNVDTTHLQVWVNRSRQYIEIIQQMIDSEFTEETGIEVDLCIMPDSQKLILANAAGEAPDVALGVDYALPYDLAIRGVLADLTEFDGWEELLGTTATGLLVPATVMKSESAGTDTAEYGIYAMPETFYFWVLYYRTDIMEKLGLEVPDTMDDVEAILPDLKNRGLDFYYPTAGTTGTRTLAMTTPLFFQYGGSLYYEDGTSALNSDTSVQAFERLTELFTIYDIPQECTSFYQHFRNGDIPIGIADYFMYNMLISAAPEIENSWEIALVPGITDESTGEVQRNIAGGAQSDIIFASDEDTEEKIVLTDGTEMGREEASWEFLSWWMSTDVQVEFGSTLQITYGDAYIWNSANLEAFEQLPWDSSKKKVILEAAEWITETARIPGSYMLERELSNAYISVTSSGETLRTTLDSAVKTINRETERKMEEFGFLDEDGNSLYVVPTVDTVEKMLKAAASE